MFDERRNVTREKRPNDRVGERSLLGQVERRGGGFDQLIYIESYLHLNVFIFNARPRYRSLSPKFAQQLRFGWRVPVPLWRTIERIHRRADREATDEMCKKKGKEMFALYGPSGLANFTDARSTVVLTV